MWAVSSNFSQIPVGATVYGYSSSKYGHVGIYIGNGMVAHNIGEIKIQSLESWIKTYKGFVWGWENDIALWLKYHIFSLKIFLYAKLLYKLVSLK